MKKCVVVLLAAGVLVFSFGVSVFASDLAWQEIGGGRADVRAVLVNPDEPSVMYLGSSSGVFKSEDTGASWRNVLSVRGANREVNFLAFVLDNNDSLYAATGNGLYFSRNAGKSWSRQFKGECTALAVLPSVIYLGTKQGLFVSKDNGNSWQREAAGLNKSPVLGVAYNPKEQNQIYVAAIDGVFRLDENRQNWERVFATHPVEDGNAVQETPEDQDEAQRYSNIRYISIDPNNPDYLYLATLRGVYKSTDKGKGWQLLPESGLLDREVKFLLVAPESIIYAVAKRGVFKFQQERWLDLSSGLACEDINSLYLDKQGNLYAACDKGLFRAGTVDSNSKGTAISLYYKDEPEINVVQQAAIKYAEVEPEKIKDWRKKAKMKAILPKLTVGLDRSENTNYEIYTSATTHYVYEGPYDRSHGWDVTLSWELGDLIWSEAQTSIDVRSRLMVELRDDILDEVTKLYFERLRVKMELDGLGIEERKKRLEKELRLAELTASLDALTGGYFSRKITKKD